MASATYNGANQRTQQDGRTLTYDPAGNLTNDGQRTYAFDARGQLAGINGPAGSASFAYDGLGRRIEKQVGAQTTRFLHDGANVAKETGAGSADLLTGLGLDETFTRTTDAGTQSLLTDAQNSTVALADEAGELKTAYRYGPFGETTQSGEPSDNPFQYTGRENDGAGLLHLRARAYSPTMGRFLSEDPIGYEGSGENLYRYAENDPVNLSDPMGLDALSDTSDFIGCWGDSYTLGITKGIRGLLGADGVNACSGACAAGGIGGMLTRKR